MDFSRSHQWQILWRLTAILGLFVAISAALWHSNLIALIVVLVLVTCLLIYDVFRLTERTHHELARFLSAAHHGDLAQSFASRSPDLGFVDLGNALDALMSKFRGESSAAHAEASRLHSMLDQVPLPLLMIDANEQVQLINRAARKQFGAQASMRLESLSSYGAALVQALRGDAESEAIELQSVNEATIRMRVTKSWVTQLGVRSRLIALQPIQADLDSAEMALWRDLVRVLTHEIMNSLTPVTSLAESARLQAEALPVNNTTKQLRDAVATVARRSDGLMQFVSRYRELTRALNPKRETVQLVPAFNHLTRLMQSQWQGRGVSFDTVVEPIALSVYADRALFEQLIINLMRNAAEACEGTTSHPRVRVAAHSSPSGRTLIDVQDNGPGIDPAFQSDIFLPFFTTKANGSGVGLSLARQIVLAHGGSIQVCEGTLGGACVRVVL